MARSDESVPRQPPPAGADVDIPSGVPEFDGTPASAGRAERYRQRQAARAARPRTVPARRPQRGDRPQDPRRTQSQPAAPDEPPEGMLPARERRRTSIERGTMRVVATGGVIGIAVILGAILVGQNVDGWIVGLVVGVVSVALAAILWSSRQL
jgi:hypothetical protein